MGCNLDNQLLRDLGFFWISRWKHKHSLKYWVWICSSSLFGCTNQRGNEQTCIVVFFCTAVSFFFLPFLCLIGGLGVAKTEVCTAFHKVIHVYIIAYGHFEWNLKLLCQRNAWMITVINHIKTKNDFWELSLYVCKRFCRGRDCCDFPLICFF